MSTSDFDTADFYDCSDDEELSHTTPEEAIEAYLDGWEEEFTLEFIRNHAPIKVRALRRWRVQDMDIEHVADHAIEYAREHFGEHFGDPNGGWDGMTLAAAQDALPLFRSAVRRLYSHAQVWTCSEVASREYSVEEIAEMLGVTE